MRHAGPLVLRRLAQERRQYQQTIVLNSHSSWSHANQGTSMHGKPHASCFSGTLDIFSACESFSSANMCLNQLLTLGCYHP